MSEAAAGMGKLAGKHKTLAIVGVVGAAILGFIAYKNRSASGDAQLAAYPAYQENTGGGGGSGSGGDVTGQIAQIQTDFQKAMQKQQDENQKSTAGLVDTFNGALATQTSGFQSMFSGLTGQLTEINNRVTKELHDYASDRTNTSPYPTHTDDQTGQSPAPVVGVITPPVKAPTRAEQERELVTNGAAWYKATPAEQQRLADRNQQIGRDLGLSFNGRAGSWTDPATGRVVSQ